jgi:hypothetical protein
VNRGCVSVENVVSTTTGERKTSRKVLAWVVSVVITLIAFYAMDHFVMSIQGLPLNWDLTPAH